MSDLNLDLNIINYNIKELEDILNLNSSHKFIDIQTSAVNIRKELFSISSLDTNKKQEIDIFLKDLVSRLERNFIQQWLLKIDTKLNNILHNKK